MKELLCPAGNFEKMKAAILYGADAVYLASDMFGMRAAADNFTLEELEQATNYAHSKGVKLYVTVNTMPHTNEYERLKKYLLAYDRIGVDALIISDLGVFELARELIPKMEIHISTQASIVSSYTASAWHKMGAKRVVLARELSLDEINEIRKNTPRSLELECFIHGSMCISYSGRCLLSNYYTGRDANRGACAQPCRWNYKNAYPLSFAEEKRTQDELNIEEYKEGSFIMSSKDMCMIEHIPSLMESGIDSFKIEGRMKSAYYTAICANTYKMAINEYLKNPEEYRLNPLWLRELESVSHREYATGFYFDNPMENPQTVTQNGYLREKAYLCVATGRSDGEYSYFTQRNKISEGDVCEIITPGETGKRFIASDLMLENGEKIQSAPHPSMEFKMKVPYIVKEGDIVRSSER
ncbi:MAG: U32 family peptidase [Clostridia bacterium]|nr:U32 family peptidase [Clostridia bacterium]MBQ7789376.1 U32 family peptidase [Clostridia bacterium]